MHSLLTKAPKNRRICIRGSCGGKRTLLSISKRGDVYLRTLLIHGSRAQLMHVDKRTDPLSCWVQGVKQRRGMNVACVALANKQARKIWVILNDKKPLAFAKAA